MVGVNGVFGERMCEVAGRHGAEVVRVDAPWGEPIDPQRLLAAHPSPAIIAVVHAETSTGVRNDIAPLGSGKGDALLLVDMVTSLGGIEVAVDEWDVDIAYSGTQKCLGVPPGLAPLTIVAHGPWAGSSSARRAGTSTSTSWRATSTTAPAAARRTTTRPRWPWWPPCMPGLGALLDEGLEAGQLRHAECGRLLCRTGWSASA